MHIQEPHIMLNNDLKPQKIFSTGFIAYKTRFPLLHPLYDVLENFYEKRIYHQNFAEYTFWCRPTQILRNTLSIILIVLKP